MKENISIKYCSNREIRCKNRNNSYNTNIEVRWKEIKINITIIWKLMSRKIEIINVTLLEKYNLNCNCSRHKL